MNEFLDKLSELEELAQIKGIPFFATVAIDNNEENTEYKNYCVTPYYLGTKLAVDYISPMLLVTNGFPVLPKLPDEKNTYDELKKLKEGEDIDIPREIA